MQTPPQPQPLSPFFLNYILPMLTYIVAGFILYKLLKFLISVFVSYYRKPVFKHYHFHVVKLDANYTSILKAQFSFYNKLTQKEQRYFRNRLAVVLEELQFIGKTNLQVTPEMKVLLGATIVMLTFGFRNYKIKLLNKFVIYPEAFYSTTNKALHKGEFNPLYKAIVVSWADVEEGFFIENDNLNLAIHEVVHAMHIDALKHPNHRATIFMKGFMEIINYLEAHTEVRQRLLTQKYFRSYAFTNQYEFIAVLVESFIETPQEFKVAFPKLYVFIKRMLNFNFAGY